MSDYNAAATGGTDYGPSNPDHLKAVRERLAERMKLDGVTAAAVPSETATASGAGLESGHPAGSGRDSGGAGRPLARPRARPCPEPRYARAHPVPEHSDSSDARGSTSSSSTWRSTENSSDHHIGNALGPTPARRRTDSGAGRRTGAAHFDLGSETIVRQAIVDSFWKLDPRIQFRNPVMFIVEVGSLLTTIVFVQELISRNGQPLFTGQVAFWLWFTVLFANFAEAMAEGRGKAQAATLRKAKAETTAVKLRDDAREIVPANALRAGDLVLVEGGSLIPGDGEIVVGVASVDGARSPVSPRR